MDNNVKVREMLKAKFSGKFDEPTTTDRRKVSTYEEAQKSGNVRDMIYHKLGIGEVLERQERREQEFASQDIIGWNGELKAIDNRIDAIRSKKEKKMEQLKIELEEEKRIEEQKALNSGVSRNGLRHLVLLDGYKVREQQN